MKNDDYYWLRKNSIEQFDSMLLSDSFIRKKLAANLETKRLKRNARNRRLTNMQELICIAFLAFIVIVLLRNGEI